MTRRSRRTPTTRGRRTPTGVPRARTCQSRIRSAKLLGEADEEPLRPPDVAEPVHVLVLDDLAADELCTMLAEMRERLVDVVHGEHDAQIAERVHRCVAVIGDDGRLDESRELEPAVAVRRAHHGNLDVLVAESGDPPRPLSLDRALAFELEAELAKEGDRRGQVFDDDPDVVHPFYRHASLFSEWVRPAWRSRITEPST